MWKEDIDHNIIFAWYNRQTDIKTGEPAYIKLVLI